MNNATGNINPWRMSFETKKFILIHHKKCPLFILIFLYGNNLVVVPSPNKTRILLSRVYSGTVLGLFCSGQWMLRTK